ncbi:MAG: copper amine oxidase N-terminal domain-containing protein [Defluviitaleaceae bacterium]|nr:copper amine oxidase N-terminal domain-containing protein [Defluviitaleaceae bacterium]
MKKWMAAFCVLVLLFIPTVVQGQSISITVDGEPVVFTGQQPVWINNTLMAPVRPVFEQMGFEVQWRRAHNPTPIRRHWVWLVQGNDVFRLGVGDGFFTMPGGSRRYHRSAPIVMMNGSTMVPIILLVENAGMKPRWDAGSNTLVINSLPAYGEAEYVGLWRIRYAIIRHHNRADEVVPVTREHRNVYVYFEQNGARAQVWNYYRQRMASFNFWWREWDMHWEGDRLILTRFTGTYIRVMERAS